jgi:hypothetical protein
MEDRTMLLTSRMLRLVVLGAALLAAPATSQSCLTTLFARDNGGSLGGAVYFDVTVNHPAGITVTTMQINTAEMVALDLTVYTTPGTYSGVETTPGVWTQVSTGQGVGQGIDIPTDVNVADFALASGSYGMALVLGPTAGHDYTGGLGALSYSDANLQIDLGSATNVPFSGSPFSPRVWNGQICYQINTVQCTINSPAPGSTVSDEVTLDFDADHQGGANIDATAEYSTDSGTSWHLCTPGPTSVNPMTGIPTPAMGMLFGWDSVTDGVGLTISEATDIRLTVTDGTDSGSCFVDVSVDNIVPSPTCTLTLPGGSPASGPTSFELDVTIPSGSPTVDAFFEFSTDGGGTFQTATPDPASANPLTGVPPATPTTFVWDSRTDGVGLAAVETGVLLQATLTDAAAPLPGFCTTSPFDVDNTSLCPGTCGDCDENGAAAVTVLDALVAAQIGAGLITASAWQTGCCDVNSTMSITILDALVMAQEAAGLAPGLACP